MNKAFVKIMRKILLLSLAVVMIGLNCRCSKQENTVQNIVLGPPAIPDCEYWYKLGEVDKDTISVLYACRSGQIGLHSELTIKKTDINGKDIYTSVIGNLPEGRWRILGNSFSCSNTMFSFAMLRVVQCERRDTSELVAYTINGNTGKLLDTTSKISFKALLGYKAYYTAEDSYTFIQNAWDNGYLFHVNKYGEDKWIRRMTRTERSDVDSGYRRDIGFLRYSKNHIIVNGKLVYDVLDSHSHALYVVDIISATEEMAVGYDYRLSLPDDEEGTGIFYKLESADFSEDILTVTYGKYCKTPIIEKEYDSILGQWIEKITGYEDVLQGKILYHISYPGGKVLDKQDSESLSHITTLSASWCGPGRKSGRPCRGFWRL